jgi:hypothetical protein
MPCHVGGRDLSVSDCKCDSTGAWSYRSVFVEEAGSVRVGMWVIG